MDIPGDFVIETSVRLYHSRFNWKIPQKQRIKESATVQSHPCKQKVLKEAQKTLNETSYYWNECNALQINMSEKREKNKL